MDRMGGSSKAGRFNQNPTTKSPSARRHKNIFHICKSLSSTNMVNWSKTSVVYFRDMSYSEEDVRNSWYSDEEILIFKAERSAVKHLVKSLGSTEMLEKMMGDKYTCQGLETFISKRKYLQKKDRIREAFNAVWTVQAEQRAAQNPSPEALIAREYRLVTKKCQREATVRALVCMAKGQETDNLKQPPAREVSPVQKEIPKSKKSSRSISPVPGFRGGRSISISRRQRY